ncbi:MAG: hypothetical protein M1828_006793 [Chrysothrix sp. TS-e1954]|nr:MAG: hypothetical protein M1828_006793 [Chrysothrix sp. TS-e1954]
MPLASVLRPTLYRDGAPGVNGQARSEHTNVSSSRSRYRRIVGYHNSVCDELADIFERPPPYGQVSKPGLSVQTPNDSLPRYSCSVSCQDVVEMKMERSSPFDVVQHAMWFEVFARLQGTLLEFHHVKMPGGFFSTNTKHNRIEPSAGRSIRRYTLQHAEIGVASDHKKVELVPRSQLATILPDSVLQRLKQTEPHLFDEVHHYVARLRLEGDQLLVRFKSSEDRTRWINQLCAAVDIAPPLDVRSEPRYHTLPRRRRRHHGRSRREVGNVGVSSAALAQQQERIAINHFPNLLPDRDPELAAVIESPTQTQGDAGDNEGDDEQEGSREQAVANSDPEADDLDMDFMDREYTGREIENMEDQVDTILGDRTDVTREGPRLVTPASKQALRVCHDPAREARYRPRCMPVLVYNSKHANDIIIRKGKALRIDWEKKALKSYAFRPPSYESSCHASRDTPMAFLKSLPFGRPKLGIDREHRLATPEPNMEVPLSASSTTDNADGSCDEEVMVQPKDSWTARIRKVASRRDLTPINVSLQTQDENEPTPASAPSSPVASTRIYNATNIDDAVLTPLGF